MDGVCGSEVQVPDAILQQGDHHDTLAVPVLVSEATGAISRNDQLNCLVLSSGIRNVKFVYLKWFLHLGQLLYLFLAPTGALEEVISDLCLSVYFMH